MNATSETVELAAQQVISTALAAALADPRSPRAAAPQWASPEAVRSAWAALLETMPQVAARALHTDERRPAEVSVEPLCAWLALSRDKREEVWLAVFGLLISKVCPPYETEYMPSTDITQRSQAMADIAGFYKAFGLQRSGKSPERFDHVSLELEFVAFCYQKLLALQDAGDAEGVEITRAALKRFLIDHPARWMATFGRALEREAQRVAAGSSELAGELAHLAGTGEFLTGWIALQRLTHDIPCSEKLRVLATVPEPPEDQGCMECMMSERQSAP